MGTADGGQIVLFKDNSPGETDVQRLQGGNLHSLFQLADLSGAIHSEQGRRIGMPLSMAKVEDNHDSLMIQEHANEATVNAIMQIGGFMPGAEAEHQSMVRQPGTYYCCAD